MIKQILTLLTNKMVLLLLLAAFQLGAGVGYKATQYYYTIKEQKQLIDRIDEHKETQNKINKVVDNASTKIKKLEDSKDHIHTEVKKVDTSKDYLSKESLEFINGKKD